MLDILLTTCRRKQWNGLRMDRVPDIRCSFCGVRVGQRDVVFEGPAEQWETPRICEVCLLDLVDDLAYDHPKVLDRLLRRAKETLTRPRGTV